MKKRLVKEKVTYCDLCDRDMTNLVQIHGLYWCGQLIRVLCDDCYKYVDTWFVSELTELPKKKIKPTV